MIIVDLPIKVVSKPRGKKGKAGNITHYKNGSYGEWQQQTARILRGTGFQMPEKFYCLSFRFFIAGRGRPDVDNRVGAWQDLLKEYNYIKDDNYLEIPEIHAKASRASRDRFIFFVCEDQAEWHELILNYDKYTK
ncbi:MAG: RusA family crossover junction endodeoxyribonuclease [Iphinoe sp. HA4291-MV1]|nr:RusA family crossover junction endodeoxyribonuclease [Iphinoe sp. HA4291-MV1]